MHSNVTRVIGEQKTALAILAVGTVLVVLLLVDRTADLADSVVKTIRDRVLSSGVLAALILVGSVLLGAPVWLAFAATAAFIATSALGKVGARVLGVTGEGTSSLSANDAADAICSGHGGVASFLTSGRTVVGRCRDGTQFP
jgi:hypothetical protein